MCQHCIYDHTTEEHDLLQKAEIPQLISNPKYRDAPRFRLIYDYENQFKNNYVKSIETMSKELAKKLISFI